MSCWRNISNCMRENRAEGPRRHNALHAFGPRFSHAGLHMDVPPRTYAREQLSVLRSGEPSDSGA